MLSLCPRSRKPYYISPVAVTKIPARWKSRSLAFNERSKRRGKNTEPGFPAQRRTYYLPETLVFSAQDSGTKDAPVVFQAYENERPVISGGIKLEKLKWRTYTNGIFQTKVPDDLQTEEIFVNGERQILARYPNFDPSDKYFVGYAADAISTNRVARWADPTGGYFHAMHPSLWGDFTWRITGKDTDNKA